MSSITKFDTAHEDLIHDVAYDYYGKRLVTCSSDQRLKVWDFVERDDSAVWKLNDTWKAHDSSILKAIWAHPEYGQVIASCSFDRQVKIWEEQATEPQNSQKRWAERFRLVESRGAVLDVAFAPTQGALRLATCAADGIVRIYEALEPTNLAQWSQMEEFEIAMGGYGLSETSKGSQQTPPPPPPPPPQQQLQPVHTNSTSSSSSSITSHALAKPIDSGGGAGMAYGAGPSPFSGGVNTSGSGQGVSPGSGPASGASATGTMQNSGATGGPNHHRPLDADSGYCIDWCPNRTSTPMMVVGLGKEIGARIFKHDGHSRWYPAELLLGHSQEVHDVSWAPSIARSYQLIATACKDHHVRIFKLTEQPSGNNNVAAAAGQRYGLLGPRQAGHPSTPSRPGHRPMQVELVASFDDHHAEVWHVEWNVTGTILSSSGDDGKLRLWKAGFDGQWRQMTVIAANQQIPPYLR